MVNPTKESNILVYGLLTENGDFCGFTSEVGGCGRLENLAFVFRVILELSTVYHEVVLPWNSTTLSLRG